MILRPSGQLREGGYLGGGLDIRILLINGSEAPEARFPSNRNAPVYLGEGGVTVHSWYRGGGV